MPLFFSFPKGFGFLHPLQPYVPYQLSLYGRHSKNDSQRPSTDIRNSFNFSITESPYWPERSFHIHTQHPLELTDVLQGHDIPQTGPHGPHCSIFSYSKRNKYNRKRNRNKNKRKHVASLGDDLDVSNRDNENDYDNYDSENNDDINYNDIKNINNRLESKIQYCERWEDMVEDVSRLFEWSVANRLNRVEWLLLGNYKWGDELDVRAKRFRVLTALGHKYSLLIGADVPLGIEVSVLYCVVLCCIVLCYIVSCYMFFCVVL